MTEETLLLVDGSGYLYRAYHALPDFRNDAGEPTGAVYGVVAMLRRLRDDRKLNRGATHGAVVFDTPGGTFRNAMYAEYKANRAEMPEDLQRQIPVIHDLVRALGWPLLAVEGVEADDVIGTLAQRASAQALETVISTGDKDLAQLVDEHITLVNTMTRGNVPAEWLDRDGVISKFGVPPERIVDYLALVGDSVDNVPGVSKVGPKTAVKWISQYGSLDGIVAHAADIGGVVGANLRAALDWLPTARELVALRMDCELGSELATIGDTLTLGAEDPVALRALFQRCGFRSWLAELDDPERSAASKRGVADPARQAQPAAQEPTTAAARDEAAPEPVYELVLDEEGLERWARLVEGAELSSFDTETTSLDPMTAELVGLSLAVAPGRACYVPVAHHYAGAPRQLGRDQVLGRLRSWLESPDHAKVGQNIKYDSHVLENHGVRLAGIAHDTMLQSYVLEAHRSHDLDSLAARHLGRATISYEAVAGKGARQIGFDQVALEQALPYAAEDAEVTLELHRKLYPQIDADAGLERIYREIELPTSKVLQRVERNGVLIDCAELQRQSAALGATMHQLEAKAHEAAGQPFLLSSPKQLGELLFGRLGLPVIKKTAGGAPSTDEDVLTKLAEDYPLPRIVLEYRTVAKLKSTYTDKLPRMVNARTGRVHTNYSQATAVTGRLSSTDPNLQNIPVRTPEGRRIRAAFVAPPGSCIVSCDYSQVELRIMAHLSRDPALLSAFADGRDLHRATAAEIFGVTPDEVSSEQRRTAKVINFGLIYGMSTWGLAGNLGIERDAAKNYIERYFSRYPGVERFMDETRAEAARNGYVETVFGRRLWLPEIGSGSGVRRQAAERAAINAPMQGTAADLIKLAMISVQGWLEQERLGTRLIMQVHDELVLEVPDAERETVVREVPRLMAEVAELLVPLVVDTGAGPNWERAH
ncbi:MAG: DNA polymerase I [Burkholderiaceae bacterium]|nr:DNA polymerase I [Burkholderiaceae bacterium]